LFLAFCTYWYRVQGNVVSCWGKMEQPLDPPREEEKALLKELAGGGRQDIYHLYLEGQFAPGGGEDRIVGVTLSKDRAVLGIFKKQGAALQPFGFVVTLPLEELRLVSLEGEKKALLTRQSLEERLGAYGNYSFYVLYHWEESRLEEIWRQVLVREEAWQKKWLGIKEEGWEGIDREGGDISRKGRRQSGDKNCKPPELFPLPHPPGPQEGGEDAHFEAPLLLGPLLEGHNPLYGPPQPGRQPKGVPGQ